MSAKLFHKFVLKHLGCGRLNEAALPEGAVEFWSWRRSCAEMRIRQLRATHPTLPHVHFDFINADNFNFNAYAFRYHGRRFIGVTTAAVAAMKLLFDRMLSDRRILPGIGSADDGREYPQLSHPILRSLHQDVSKNGQSLPQGARSDFSDFLSAMAFDFLIFHELTHIRNGHVDYAYSKGAPFIRELDQGEITQDDSIESQALEVDADVGATGFLTNILDEMTESGNVLAKHLEAPTDVYCAFGFSMSSFFRFFSDVPLSGTDLCKFSHPPFRFRFRCVADLFTSAAANLKACPRDSALMSFAQGEMLAEQAFHILAGDPIEDPLRTIPRFREAWDDVGNEHRNRLKKRWDGGLRDSLKKYAFGSPMTYDAPPR